MIFPAFLSNLQLETSLALEHHPPYALTVLGQHVHSHAGGPDFWLSLKILETYSPTVNSWLDTHHITGHAVHSSIAEAIARIWFMSYCWESILSEPEQSPGLTNTLIVAKRLLGFFPSLRHNHE